MRRVDPQQELELCREVVERQRARIRDLEKQRAIDAGRRRIISRALRKDGFSVAQIGLLTGVSNSQVYNDLKREE